MGKSSIKKMAKPSMTGLTVFLSLLGLIAMNSYLFYMSHESFEKCSSARRNLEDENRSLMKGNLDFCRLSKSHSVFQVAIPLYSNFSVFPEFAKCANNSIVHRIDWKC